MLTRSERIRKAWKRLRLRLRRGSGSAIPIFIFGAQRSGTNMLIRAFNRHPDTECFYENDDEAFDNYMLRSDQTVLHLIASSHGKWVVFKPICDSQHARRLLDLYPESRAVWIYRHYEDVVNSALRRWKQHRGQIELMVKDPKRARWRVECLRPEMRKLVREQYEAGISDASAQALMWYLRNHHFFRQKLDQDPRVVLVNYERLVTDPHQELERLFEALGLRSERAIGNSLRQSSIHKNPAPEIAPDIVAMCQRMYDDLERLPREADQPVA